jgi:hypothetical protein
MNAPLSSRTALAVAAALAVVVYLPSLGNGFALDDTGDIVENTAVHGLANGLDIVTSPYRGRVPAGRSPYRPVTSLSYALSWSMGSGSPLPFHMFNGAVHATNTALVTTLLSTLGAIPLLALLGGALFAVHPVHAEAVANSVGRGDALMTLFVLLAALAYVSRFRSEWVRGGLVCVAYMMALGSKENGVVLPALLVTLSFLFPARHTFDDGERIDPRRALTSQVRLFGALALVLATYLALRYQVLGTLVHRDAAPYIVILPASLRVTTAVANLTELTALLLFPTDLVADYGPGVILPAGLGAARFWAGVGSTLVLVALGLWGIRRSPWLTLGIAWAALSLLVLSNLLFPVGVWVAERTLYLPSIGVSFLAVAVGQRILARPKEPSGRVPRFAIAAAVALILVGSAQTWMRNRAWSDTEAVFLTLAEDHPESFRAQWWIGMRLIEGQDPDRGLDWLRQAMNLNPNELRLQLDYVRGLLLSNRAEAARALVATLPPAEAARDVYLAQSHIQLDELDRARGVVREGLVRFPNDARLLRQARELGLEEPYR